MRWATRKRDTGAAQRPSRYGSESVQRAIASLLKLGPLEKGKRQPAEEGRSPEASHGRNEIPEIVPETVHPITMHVLGIRLMETRNVYAWLYFGLIGSFLAFFCLHTVYGLCGNDFWEHAAVVKELATHPWMPRHPLLLVDKPHAFFSPYLLAVAIIAKATGWNPINTLMLAGMVNLFLLLLGLRYFIRMLVAKDSDLVASYALLLIVFLWPASAWPWSGFVHFGVLGLVLPYPSTAALALSFFFLVQFRRALERTQLRDFAWATLLQSLILLMHPTTAVFSLLAAGIFTLHVSRLSNPAVLTRAAAIVLLSMSLAALWPYYPLLDLLRGDISEFNEQSAVLYEHVWARLWPTLIGLLLLLPECGRRLRRDLFDPVQRWNSVSAIPIAGLVFLCLFLNYDNRQTVKRALAGARIFASTGFKGYEQRYAWMERALSQVGQYDVVLSDLESGWFIPAFSGKVIASGHPVHWVNDILQRQQDLERFFSAATSTAERRAILGKYGARFILVSHPPVPTQQLPRFAELGKAVYERDAWTLIRYQP